MKLVLILIAGTILSVISFVLMVKTDYPVVWCAIGVILSASTIIYGIWKATQPKPNSND